MQSRATGLSGLLEREWRAKRCSGLELMGTLLPGARQLEPAVLASSQNVGLIRLRTNSRTLLTIYSCAFVGSCHPNSVMRLAKYNLLSVYPLGSYLNRSGT